MIDKIIITLTFLPAVALIALLIDAIHEQNKEDKK